VLQEETFDATIEGVINIFNEQCHVELEIYLG
jgi:hypothetical protein